jgi:DMSO/TMAO reductase YedYZ molybdopterin-dependent catalytic subunit
MMRRILTRRQMLLCGSTAFCGILLGGCDRLSNSPSFRRVLDAAEGLSYRGQRLLVGRNALAREFSESELSPVFRSNGTGDPDTPEYNDLAAGQFRQWRLKVGGLVSRPQSLSLDDLRALSARTQITRHDCVEGWSAIGQWKGVPLSTVLNAAGLAREAKYIVFYCADILESGADPYYESIDLIDAFHPQTILAYELNGKALPVANGAPLRLRVERQLGYKHAKYLMKIEAVQTLAQISGGKGGFWEDRGYEWYAGI